MKKFTTISQYINSYSGHHKKRLNEIYQSVKSVSKDAEEGLKWSMPAFYKKRILVTFAAFKDHVSFFPTPSAITPFKKELKKFKTSRGTIQFPLNKPIPKALVKKITLFRVKEEKANKLWKGE